jgi:UDP-glucose 4-epimerase
MARHTVVITGGAGFIGSRVTEILVDRGYEVRIFDNLARPDLAALERLVASPHVELIEGDVRYADAVRRAVTGSDFVIHLAAVSINKSIADPAESLDINIIGSNHVFQAAADERVRRLVFASSASVYGEPERLPMPEEGPFHPATPYCLSKLAAEHLLDFYGRTTGLEWNALRYFNVYGPGQKVSAYYTSVVLAFLTRIQAGEPPIIDGEGSQSMDFIHVQDIARATADAMESERWGYAMNIGTGITTSIADLAAILIEVSGVDVEPIFRPRDVLVSRRAADIALAEDVMGWKPEISVEDGLRDLVASLGTNSP